MKTKHFPHPAVTPLQALGRLSAFALGALSLLGFVHSTYAQSLKAPLAQTSNNLYAGLDVGAANTSNRATDTASRYAVLAAGTATVEQDRNKAAVRLYGGYRLNELADVELGYLQSGSYNSGVSGTKSGGTAYSGSETFKFSGFDYSLVLRPKVATGYNAVFLKVGGHSLTRKLDSAVPGVLTSNNSLSGSGLLYGLGYDLQNVWRGIDLRLAYTHYDRIGGESGSKGSLYSLGVVKRY